MILAAIAALFSCAKENPATDSQTNETFTVELFASAPSQEDTLSPASASTRTTLVDGNGSKFVHWSKGDAIKVLFFPHCISHEIYSGLSGVFHSYFTEESSKGAFFKITDWSWKSNGIDLSPAGGKIAPGGIAVYPHTATAISDKILGFKPNSIVSEVSFDLPSTQKAIKNNIESGLNFSYARIDATSFKNTIDYGSSTKLSFNNACAMIEVTMPKSFGSKKVTSISIKSNSDGALTGKGKVNLGNWNDYGTENIIPEDFSVSISNGSDVNLSNPEGFEAGEKYYFVVWPGVHSTGLTIQFNAEDGTFATKTTKPVELTASQIKPYTISSNLEFQEKPKYNYYYADGTQGNEIRSDIVGVIIFHGNPKEKMNDSSLPDQYCNGIAISLKSVNTVFNNTKLTSANFSSPLKHNDINSLKACNIGGYTIKNKWTEKSVSLKIYDAGYPNLPDNTSGWYLPVINEWTYICEMLDEINTNLSAIGGDNLVKNTSYWMPFLYGSFCWCVKIDTNPQYTKYEYNYTSNSNYTRPIFAF